MWLESFNSMWLRLIPFWNQPMILPLLSLKPIREVNKQQMGGLTLSLDSLSARYASTPCGLSWWSCVWQPCYMCGTALLHALQLSRFLRHTHLSMAEAVKMLMGCKWTMLELQSTSTRQVWSMCVRSSGLPLLGLLYIAGHTYAVQCSQYLCRNARSACVRSC